MSNLTHLNLTPTLIYERRGRRTQKIAGPMCFLFKEGGGDCGDRYGGGAGVSTRHGVGAFTIRHGRGVGCGFGTVSGNGTSEHYD